MIAAQYFPLGLATGEAFCNRVQERTQLLNNFKSGQHTVLISSRRCGKSSLAINAIKNSKLPYEKVDLFVAVNTEMVAKKIVTGVKNLISKVTTGPEQALFLLKNYFKKLKGKWVIGTDGINLELSPDKKEDPITHVLESLFVLDMLLAKKKQKAIFFIDEFQEIGILDQSKGIEAAIRQVAQECQYIVFIFSGSNRHILSEMVDNRSRPLYMLCDRIDLGRISAEHYEKYLNKIAKMAWGENLTPEAYEEILTLTERHPYYVNALCNKIWSQYEKHSPNAKEVKKVWQNYILQEESKAAKELSTLRELQKRLLIFIAQGHHQLLTGKFVQGVMGVTSASLVKALKSLHEKDYLYRDAQGNYSITDPLLKGALQFFYA